MTLSRPAEAAKPDWVVDYRLRRPVWEEKRQEKGCDSAGPGNRGKQGTGPTRPRRVSRVLDPLRIETRQRNLLIEELSVLFPTTADVHTVPLLDLLLIKRAVLVHNCDPRAAASFCSELLSTPEGVAPPVDYWLEHRATPMLAQLRSLPTLGGCEPPPPSALRRADPAARRG